MYNQYYREATTFFVIYILCIGLLQSYIPSDGWIFFIALFVTISLQLVDEETQGGVTNISEILSPLLFSSLGTSDKYIFASSLPLSINNVSTGMNIKDGIEAAFISTNIRGGINGKKVELRVLDDADSVTKTKENAIQFSNSDAIAMLAPVGMDCTSAAIKHFNKPIIGPFTSSILVRNPSKSVLNLSVLNYDVLNYFTQYFTTVLKKTNYATFAEDSFEHIENSKMLDFITKQKNPNGIYNPLKPYDIVTPIANTIAKNPDVIFVFSDNKYVCKDFIEQVRKKGVTSSIAFVTLHIHEILDYLPLEFHENLFYITNIPDITNIKLDIVTQFKKDILLVTPARGPNDENRMLLTEDRYLSMYGYLVGKCAVEFIKNAVTKKNEDTVKINDYIIEFNGQSRGQAKTYMFLYEVIKNGIIPLNFTPDEYVPAEDSDFVVS